jgi:porin
MIGKNCMPGLHQSLVQSKKPLLVSFITASLLVFAMHSHQAQAEEAPSPNWQEDTLTGDWGGLRQAWYAKGVDIGVLHKSDVLLNVSGGLKRGTAWLGHTEIRATFDLDNLLGFSEATANFVYQSDLGSKFNTHYVGAFMGVDNIEVGTNTA